MSAVSRALRSQAGHIGRPAVVAFAASSLLLGAGLPAQATEAVPAQGAGRSVPVAPAVAAEQRPVAHTVVSGDTLGTIAATYGVALESVFALNGMGWDTIIYPGDLITVNGGAEVGGPVAADAAPAPAPVVVPEPGGEAVAAPAPARLVSVAMTPATELATAVPAASADRLSPPMATMAVNSPFGYRVNPLSGAAAELHTGLDLAAGCDTPVFSSAAGTVAEAGFSAYGGGNRVVINHGNGLQTTYNHLETISVHTNQSVGRGTIVGIAGDTGAASGCHLHFEVLSNGQSVDPAGWL